MVQGGGAFRKDAVKKKLNGKVKAAHSRKQIENKSRRYNQTVIPKDPHRLELYKSGQKVSKMINKNIEKLIAGKVYQSGEHLNINDIRTKGKEHAKEVKRLTLKTKKTGIEEKMKKLKEKLDKEESKFSTNEKAKNSIDISS